MRRAELQAMGNAAASTPVGALLSPLKVKFQRMALDGFRNWNLPRPMYRRGLGRARPAHGRADHREPYTSLLAGQHLRGDGFTEIKTSKLVGTGTEEGTGLFSVDCFDAKMFLAQLVVFTTGSWYACSGE